MAQPFSTSASSSASTSYPRHDVFLNHRGPDCKHTFAIRLYRRLRYQGLRVFLDSEELIEGKNITSQLEAAIKEASVQVAIFSPTYAKSEWCLNELVLMVNSGATILPVFYDVEPSMVKRATGTYGEALQNLQKKKTRDPQTGELNPRYDSNTVQSWRDALLRVGGISGFVLSGDEFELLEKVVQSVRENVPKTPLYVATYPTGLDQKLRDLERMVEPESQELERMVEPESQELKPVGAKIVGIVGVGGVGKTTLAKHFFNLKRSRYDASSFLFDVREKARSGSLNYLQSQLIQELKHTDIKIEHHDQGIGELEKHLSSCKRVLIILDDIDHIDQMKKLLPMKDSLSQESLILVTSRDRHVLRVEEKSIYYLKVLDRPDSKVLFCSHAFFQRYPPEGFADLVDGFVTACDGLPLSLEVFGAAVRGRKQSYWEEMLERLHERLPTEIQEKLGISYESLEKEDQKIFLDIVCFFLGEEIDTAIRIWGVVGLENLESKCLLEVDSEKKIKMHDHIRDMGRIIAKQGSLPRRLSQIDDFLEHTSSGMAEVRGISMVPRVPDSLLFTSPSHLKNPKWELFHKYSYDCMNLKILATEGGYLEAILRRVPSAPLLWLCWYHCPYSSLPSWVPMENLRVLEVAGSRLETLWQLESQAPLELRELNIFSPLSHFPKSIGQLNHLEKIFVGHESCILRLKSLPEEFCNLHSLKCLTLQSCSVLVSLPDYFGRLTSLQRINLNRASSLMTLPNSFGNLTNLQHFTLLDASRLEMLPYSFGNLTNLQHFELSGASKLETLPNSFGNLTNLQHFELSGASSLETLPYFLGNLTNLQHFALLDASRLETLPNSFGNLTNLQHFELSGASRLETLPNSFQNLTNLRNISLSAAAVSLETLPNASGNLATVSLTVGFQNSFGDIIGDVENLHMELDFQNFNINMSGTSSLERLPPTNVFGNVRNVFITFSLSGASSLERLQRINFFGDIENVFITVDFKNVNINMSGASSLESLMLLNFFGNSREVFINMSGASSLERLLLPNFFGDIESVYITVDFQNVNINMSGAASLETLPIFLGNLKDVYITLSSGASSLERLPLPLPNFLGDIENVYMTIHFQHVNINMAGAFSLERLPLPNFLGDIKNVYMMIHFQHVNINMAGAFSLERLPLPNFLGDIENVYPTINFEHVNINMAGAFSLERLPLPNFLGDIENVYPTINFQHVNINMAGASSLETLRLPLPNFLEF